MERNKKKKKKKKIKKIEKALMQFTLTPSLCHEKSAHLKEIGKSKKILADFYSSKWLKRGKFYLKRANESAKAQILNILWKRVKGMEALGYQVVLAWGTGGQAPSFGKGNISTSAPFYLASPKNVRFSIFLALTNI